MIRRFIAWLRRRYRPEDEIGFQRVEYDAKTGKLRKTDDG